MYALPDGMNVVNHMSHIDQSTNHFFYKQHANTSPEVMKPKKKKLYCQVFGVSEDSTFSFCSSCCEYFAAMPWVSHIDNSNKTLREKVANICSHLPGVPDWIFPDENEQLELDDFNSDGSLFGQISVPVMELLTSKLHFLLEETCCYLCCLSYLLF